MSERRNLPDFTNPPVIEVALSLQFERLSRLRAAHLGALWGEFRSRFPRTEDHPPRDLAVESFGGFTPSQMSVQFQTGMPVPRVWFLNDAGTELIQVQQDCFVHNWRKVGAPKVPYPRYEAIRRTFENELEMFLQFVERQGLGAVVPNQCEITYVNHIAPGAAWNDLGDLEKVIAPWSGRYSDDFLQRPEQGQCAIRYLIPGAAGEPIGRLHIELSPAADLKAQTPLFVLTLTARGRPASPDVRGALAFLDVGRQWIVRGFAAITTKTMHQAWGRTDAG